MKRNHKFTLVAIATMAALYGTQTFAVQVTPEQSGQLNPVLKGEAESVSRYRGDRIEGKLGWKEWSNDMEGLNANSPKNYKVYEVKYTNPNDEEPVRVGELNLNNKGFNAQLEKNVPFKVSGKKVVGMYFDEWAYWERAFTADFVPAKNLTHVYYGFVGICDFGSLRPVNTQLPVTNNNGLKAEGNERGANILKAMCGQGKFPLWNGSEQDWNAGLDTPAKQQGDFNITKYDPQASHFGFDAMKKMKQVNPQLKAIVSIGGWTLSSPFHAMVETQAGRDIFVKSAMKFLADNPFVDGLDLDWEFVGFTGPSDMGNLAIHGVKEERARYTSLVKQLRKAMDDKYGTGEGRKELSAAVGASPAKLSAIDFNALKDDFDYINIMSYDMYGAFTRNPSHQAAVNAKPLAGAYTTPGSSTLLKDESGEIIKDARGNTISNEQAMRNFSTEGAIKAILDNNPDFPAEKLNLGAAAYSRGWHSVSVKPEHDKLFWHGIANGTEVSRKGLGSNGTFENGVTDYRELYDNYVSKNKDVYYDTQAEAAYIWEPIAKVNNNPTAHVESFDSQRSVIAKGQLVKKYGLGGMFAWAASNDNGLILNSMNAAVCNKLDNGNYYNFTEKYNGEVNTTVVSEQNGIATKVDEVMNLNPAAYKFNGETYCESTGEEEGQAPTAKLSKTSITAVATLTTNFGYAVEGSSNQQNVSYAWDKVEGDAGITLKSKNTAATQVVVKSGVKDASARFRLTVTSKDDKKLKSEAFVNVTVIAPAVTVSGGNSMASNSPLTLKAKANFDNGQTGMQYTWKLSKDGQVVANGINQSGKIKAGLEKGNYTASVEAYSDKGPRRATSEHQIKVTANGNGQVKPNQPFIDGLKLVITPTDKANAVTFNGVTSSTADPKGNPAYSWTVPANAQNQTGGKVKKGFTIKKTDAEQRLNVSVEVKVGKLDRTLTQSIVVPAKAGSDDNGNDNGNGQAHPKFEFGKAYKGGDKVMGTDGSVYECKGWPATNWCNVAKGTAQEVHYTPGSGVNWSDAWIKI